MIVMKKILLFSWLVISSLYLNIKIKYINLYKMTELQNLKKIIIDILKFSLFNVETDDAESLFKKINMTFKALKFILKNLISKIDEENYKKALNNEIKFPKDMDSLTIIIGAFDKAFSDDNIESLFNIVDFHSYSDLYTISEINALLIPFVADDKIKTEKLKNDYIEFTEHVKEFVCNVLNLNDKLDNSIIIRS